ncbi:MAG: Gfo/Idh/MocA family oxidoreductase [Candidatus Marinimicrobia bacterium]|nr:Gfo/Idh/MocA family oxidoreductase [Candidatus Neomarinimicrobiota bacterium]
MSPIRTGFIGAGDIARSHAGILKDNRDVVLGAVYDIKEDISRQFAAEHGMQYLSSIEAVIDDSDAVYIASPNKSHAELTLLALEQKKHVFCEKPFALNLSDAQKIMESGEGNGQIYQLGFNRRFAPVYWKMKELILAGEIFPKSFNIKMNRGELQVPAWLSDPEQTGGFLFESALHLVDIVRYLFGDVRKVTAVGSKSIYPCVDDFSIIFEMESGIHGVFSSTAHATWIFPFERVEIYGDHSSIFNNEMESVSFCLDLESEVEKLEYSQLPIEDRWGYRQENKAFIDRISGQQSDESSLVATKIDGYKNVELLESIYDQIGLGR